MDQDDRERMLLTKALDGDQESLIELLESVGPRVRARIDPKIGRHLRITVDVDDVMQVTYLEAVTRIASFEGDLSGFVAWLTRIAENNVIDAGRMAEAAKRPNPRNRVTGGSHAESMVALVEAIGATVTTPSRVAAANEIGGALERSLARLPEVYARVIRLYDLKGMNAAAVGQELGKSEGAVYMLRARAHERLRDVIGSESQFFTVHG
ncbi:MAG: RNA polymerase sigma factor [Phycisphaerales bacterium JB040]